jgi:hypothetical protein
MTLQRALCYLDRLAKIARFRLMMPIAYTVKSVEKTNKQVMIDVEVYKYCPALSISSDFWLRWKGLGNSLIHFNNREFY